MLKCEQTKKKWLIPSEAVYVISIILMAFSVAMVAEADFGVSMIVAPAYILSLKVPFLTFGLAEYVIQALLMILFCIMIRRVKPIYLFAFVTCLIYGAVLDLWRLVPCFNPAVTASDSLPVWLRIVYFITGGLITAFAVALCFRTYLYPQVYDFFVSALTGHFHWNQTKFKTLFDLCMLATAALMTFALFGELRGIGVGTLVVALVNGVLIGLFGKLIDKFFEIKPFFPRLEKLFKVE